jgi:ribosome-associated protein
MKEIRVQASLLIPSSEVRESFARSTGPGGQNVNKLATKVELRWTPAESAVLSERDRDYLLRRLGSRLTEGGELIVTCEEYRTQLRNREEARNKLAAVVRQALHRPKRRRVTKPTKASVARRLSGKKHRSQIKKTRGRGGDEH